MAQPIERDPAEQVAASDDDAIIRAIAAGDVSRFDEFVDRYKTRIFRYALQRTGDAHAAEDITQDVFLRVFRSAGTGREDAPRFAGRSSAATWIFSIARHRLADHFRAARRRPLVLESEAAGPDGSGMPDPVDPSRGPEEEALRSEEEARARVLLDKLPEEQREVLALRAWAGLGMREIAEVVDCPVATARSRLRGAVEKLQRLLPRKELP